jgi:hypothetical protein
MVTSLAWEATPDGSIGTITTGGHRLNRDETTLVRSYILFAHAKSRFFGTGTVHLLEYGTSCQARLPMNSTAFYRLSLGGLPLNSVYRQGEHNRPSLPLLYCSHLLVVDPSWTKMSRADILSRRADRVLATLFSAQLHIFQDSAISVSWDTYTRFWKFVFGNKFPIVPTHALGSREANVQSIVANYLDYERDWADNFTSRLDNLCRDKPMPSERDKMGIIETIVYLEFLMAARVGYHERRSDFLQSLGLESVKSHTLHFKDRNFKPNHADNTFRPDTSSSNQRFFRDNQGSNLSNPRSLHAIRESANTYGKQKRKREASVAPLSNAKSQRFVSRIRSRSRSQSQSCSRSRSRSRSCSETNDTVDNVDPELEYKSELPEPNFPSHVFDQQRQE